MASKSFQSIHNLSYHVRPGPDEFPQFRCLPKELRLQIWRQALRRNRFIRIELEPLTPAGEPPNQHFTENHLGKLVTEGSYYVRASGYHLYSDLLRVNIEARHEALRFYRIRFPYYVQDPQFGQPASVLYLNPEYDFVHLIAERWEKETPASFMHDLIAYDPLGIGLQNLAVDYQTMSRSEWADLDPQDMDTAVRTAYQQTLSQLREVFFVGLTNVARANPGFLRPEENQGKGVVHFSESFPIMSREPVFDRLCPRDPRPIGGDLAKVIIGPRDPREIMALWRQILDNSGIHNEDEDGCDEDDDHHAKPQEVAVRYSYLLAQRPIQEADAVFGPEDAERFLEKEGKRWENTLKTLNREIDAAFGFWLFPIDLDESRPLTLAEDQPWNGDRVLDLSDHWPELALSEMWRGILTMEQWNSIRKQT
ncbi:hypothetical protein PG990_007546 [Apiospora arundinis]